MKHEIVDLNNAEPDVSGKEQMKQEVSEIEAKLKLNVQNVDLKIL